MRRLSSVTSVGFTACLLSAAAGAQMVAPMRADVQPSFDVATIKPSAPASQASGFITEGRRVTVLNQTVESMLIYAYGVQKSQVVGAPPWFGTDHYDVNGIADAEGEPSQDQVKIMVRRLLTDRYQLHLHTDQRELSVYALRVAKGGPKLAKAKPAQADAGQTGTGGKLSDWHFNEQSMLDFAHFLQFVMDRPVVDQTGISGKYDFELRWASNQVLEHDPEAGPGLFTAMPEQIGLRLEAARAPAMVLIIDHVTRPSEN